MPRCEAGSATTEPSTAPGCIPSHRASTSTWSGGPCRSTSDCAAGPSRPGPGWTLSVSVSPGSSSTGTSSRAPKVGLWEPGEGRPSRRVLREPGGAIPPGHSPGGITGIRAGIAVCIVVGAVAGAVTSFEDGAWPAYELTQMWLALQHRLPPQLMDFLDDAQRTCGLRQGGATCPFRHSELQHQ